MAGRHIRYNVAGKYFESSTSGDGSSGFSKLDLSGHTELKHAFAVGGIYTNITGVDPATELGYGTWAQIAAGRTLVGLNGADTDFDTVRETGGSKTQTLAIANMPAHAHPGSTVSITDPGHFHTQDMGPNSSGGAALAADNVSNKTEDLTGNVATTGITATTTIASQGSGTAFSIVQPYYVVYFWERTA